MFSRLFRLAFSVLLALTPIATSAVIAFPMEQPTPSLATLTPVQHAVGTVSGQSNAARIPTSDLPSRPFEIQRPSGIVLRPDLRPLAAGAPQTITLEIVPATLIANSGVTAIITATVYDLTGDLVSGVNLSGFITPSTRGALSALSVTDANGQSTGSWTAGTAIGSGTIEIGDDVISETASISLAADVPFTVTLQADPTSQTVGASSALTATVVDQYGNAVANNTSVSFASNIGSPIAPASTTNGIATSSISSNVAGTAFITATSGSASGSASVIFTPGSPFIVTLQANPTSQSVGASSALTATVVDQYGNAVPNGTSVGFTTSRGSVLTPRVTTNGIATSSISSNVAGTAFITATAGGHSGFTSVVFNPGAPYTLTLQPPTAVISAGQRITYTAIATDTFGNPIGNVTGSTAFSITPASGGVFAANAVTPTIKNTWIVTGVNGSAVSTATLTVTAAAFNRLTIENAPAGTGSAVNAVTLNIYNTLTVYAAAYDVYNNLIGARSVTWGGTGVVAGNLAQTTGISTTFTPVVSGTGTITATSSGITDTSGIITVQAPFLRISKTASPDPLTPGSPLQYTILYTNTGNAPAQNVIITETYPISTAFFSAAPAPTAGTNVWSIGSLAVNDPQSIVVFMTTTNQMPVGTVLTNSMRMSAAKVTSAIYTMTTQVNALPDLSVSVTDSPDPA
ncbi:MAG TPA: hypothetical protein VFF59_03925, partial [Anaerolineae bacterium]|nr:hypothetical protein [Anaerolineae bacterium]